jgi:hypothetical protein
MTRVFSQTAALFLDAYRELNSKKMFWIVLILSGLAVVAFALVGVTDKGITLAGHEFPIPVPAGTVYKVTFSTVLIHIWLTWVVAILALISTASIFPDFIAGGSVDLYLSKPISRIRLFLTKYVTGLLFVALQVAVFCVLAFFLMRWRGKAWEPGLFLAIPIVVCFFSYLFSVQVLLGLLTRSTVASLLLTLLVWFVIFGVHFAETRLLAFKLYFEQRRAAWDARADQLDAQIQNVESKRPRPTTEPNAWETASRTARDDLRRRAAEAGPTIDKLAMFHRIAYGIMAVAPKTTETVDLLERNLISRSELDEMMDSAKNAGPRDRGHRGDANDMSDADDPSAVGEGLQSALRARPLTWILGTSFIFEGVMLALGGWMFCRRDY